MKTTLSKFAIAAVAGLVVAAVGAPANAGCPGSQFLDATSSYLVSNPDWGGANSGGDGSCTVFNNGCYDFESGPPVSQNMKGVFWAVGSGNPATGLGNDCGIFCGGFGATDFWLKQNSATFTQGLYHYPAWLSLKLGYNYVTGPPVTWSAPDADGCGPSGSPPQQVCTCFMVTDEWNGAGYFATLCAQSDVLGNTRYPAGEVIRLAPVPKPLVTQSVRDQLTGDVTATVGLANSDGNPNTPAEGVYSFDGCPSGLQGFRVFGAVVPRGATPSPGQFVELPRADGSPQGNNGFGSQVSVRADCNPGSEQDLYLATKVIGEGATPFATGTSGAHTRVPCGSNMATPGRGKGDDPRPDRGRDRR